MKPMLPAERNEIWVKRLCVLAMVAMALFIILWVVRLVSASSHHLLEQRNIPTEDGRAPAVRTA